jgi:outer membrane lipoprotein-sorting protein
MRVILAPVLAVFGAFAAQATSLEQVLAKMDESSSSFRAMSSSVRRVAHTAVINEDSVDTGTMFLKRPRPRDLRMVIELTEPDQKSVAFQGRKLEIYMPKIQTVQEYDVGKSRDLLEQFLLLGFGSSGKELSAGYAMRAVGQETVSGQKTTKIELIPKSKQVLEHLKKVELWISDDGGYPVQQKFYLQGGDYTLVTYSNIKLNPDLPDSALRLKLGKNVKREFPQK